jgi:hypothetical protein
MMMAAWHLKSYSKLRLLSQAKSKSNMRPPEFLKVQRKTAQLFHTTPNVYAAHLPCQSKQRQRLCISWEESLPHTARNSYHGICLDATDLLDSNAQVAYYI